MTRLTDATLQGLEAQVLDLLAGRPAPQVEVLGYGEVTTVLSIRQGAASFAVKRLPPFVSQDEVGRHVDSIQHYVSELTRRGVQVVDTELRVLPRPAGGQVLYLVQPRLPAHCLGPEHLRVLGETAARAAFARILDTLAVAVDARLAPDGQLANWAFVDGAPVYFDVSTPFILNADGSLGCDWSFFVRSMPGPLRPLVRQQIPRVVRKYCTLRHQVLDLLANLKKERLDRLIPPLLADANERFASAPIRLASLERYYAGDARTYAALQAARRSDRFVTRHLLRRPYPVLLPPPIDRGV